MKPEIPAAIARLMRDATHIPGAILLGLPPDNSTLKRIPHLTVSFDEYGRTSIDGKLLKILNSETSNHGKLFAYFEYNKARPINKKELTELFPAKNYQQALRDLRKDLSSLNYKLHYFKPRFGDYTYYGLVAK